MFNFENPVMQFLCRVADLMILNILFMVCSLPIFTIGASLCALNQVTQDMAFDCDRNLFKRFFAAFKSNFKQGTILWLITVFIYVALICDFVLIIGYFNGTASNVLVILLAILLFLVTAVLSFMYPLIVRYQNTMKEHMYNAMILAITKFPKTICMTLLLLFPAILVVLFPVVFVQTMVFWTIIGFAFVSFVVSSVYRPVFEELEKDKK